jgi:hypothetical protein
MAVGPDSALSPVSADRMDAMVGLRAAADLSAGSLLTESAVTEAVIPASDESVVGVALAPQQLTTEPLIPGDRIRVVSTAAAGDEPPEDAPLEIAATVLGVDHTDTGHVVVNVKVPRGFDWRAHSAIGRAQAEAERSLYGRGRVLLRPSGTEPVLRVMVEGEPKEAIESAAQLIAAAVRDASG